ncbi:MAG: serine O-acetyltransferase [Bacteroidales bacterium]|nr:serine O-acetyltransferase [Bacteroidales bacterium]
MKVETKNIVRIKQAVASLSDFSASAIVCHDRPAGGPMPSIQKLGKIVKMVREILFPGYFENTSVYPDTLPHYMGVYVDELFRLLAEQTLAGLCFSCNPETMACRGCDVADRGMVAQKRKAQNIATEFITFLPELRRLLIADVEAAYNGDPATYDRNEVIFCYPAIRAISSYRMAHRLVELGVPLIPRIITEMAHSETGIDINPDAKIGEYFTIDHGTGVVIGATCIIGNNVKLYQGVTLGAKSFPLDEHGNPIKGIPRHPVVEDNVVIYAQATILGRITIGHDTVIGGNVWVTHDVPPHSNIVQFKARETTFSDGAGI